MKVNKLSIRHVIEKYRARKDSKSILICRLTYYNKRKQFSTGLSINSTNWNSKQQQAEPPEPDLNYINTQLSLIRQDLNQAFLFLQVKGTPFTVIEIYSQYKGETPKDELAGIHSASHFSIIFKIAPECLKEYSVCPCSSRLDCLLKGLYKPL